MNSPRPHRIDLVNNPDDLETITLADQGMSNKLIRQYVPYSNSQITSRLSRGSRAEGKAKGRGYRLDYRDGISQTAQWMLAHRNMVRRAVLKRLLHANIGVDNSPKKGEGSAR